MKQRQRGMIILSVVLALLVLLFYWLMGPNKRFQWFESYRFDSDQPYGVMFLHKLLEGYRPGADVVVNKQPLSKAFLDVDDYKKTDYVFVGQNIFLDEQSKASLIRFLEGGGDAFITSRATPVALLEAVYTGECGVPLSMEPDFSDSVEVNLFHPALKTRETIRYAYHFMGEDRPYLWNEFDEAAFCDSATRLVPLGYYNDDRINFVKIRVGAGNLYLHSNPLLFTNYFLVRPEARDYAGAVFSHLKGRDLIWDEYSKIPYFGDGSAYNSPLYYIMQQPSLKYAWWLLLVAVIFYLIFAGKRRQKPIPITEPKTNTSLEFVNLISRLHHNNANHLDMAHKKMRYFLYFVRSKYGIHAEHFKDEHIRKLAEKSKVDYRQVEAIFLQYDLIEEKFHHNIEANRLVDLYESIENFYSQCK